MSIKPRLEAYFKEIEQGKAQRRKTLEEALLKIESRYSSGSEVEKNFATIYKMVVTETVKRDEEVLALLILHMGLAGYVDELNRVMQAVQKRLQELGTTTSKIQEIEELTKKYDELFQEIDKLVKRGVEKASKETPYVT